MRLYLYSAANVLVLVLMSLIMVTKGLTLPSAVVYAVFISSAAAASQAVCRTKCRAGLAPVHPLHFPVVCIYISPSCPLILSSVIF